VSGAFKRPIIAATFHRGIAALIGHLRTQTHSLLAKANLIGRISLARSDRMDGRREKMLPMGISAKRRRPRRGLQQSTLT
jgi:hypothetical protein